jgi:hypothetical protein
MQRCIEVVLAGSLAGLALNLRQRSDYKQTDKKIGQHGPVKKVFFHGDIG